MTSPLLDAGSFRDRQGRVFYHQGRVYRALSSAALDAWRALEASQFFRAATDAKTMVATTEVDLTRDANLSTDDLAALSPHWVAALEHERIPFLSYPYEWSFSMLQDAARLQLDLLRGALEEGLIAKDASSYNVQFRGAKPTFIDTASFEPWTEGEPWVGYLQFCQLFLYPLLLTAYRGIPFQPWLRGSLDGVTPEDCNRLLTFRDRMRPGVLADVYIQAKLQAKTSGGDQKVRNDMRKAGFSRAMILGNVNRLSKVVDKLSWQRTASEWADYATVNSYDEAAHAAKARFVEAAAGEKRWPLAWDLGANTGTFSRLIAPHADTVVSLDIDALAIERLYCQLRADGPTNILPLVFNLADASPGLGWRTRERKTLDERGHPDFVLCLALIHHLVLRANIPLPDVIAWLGTLDTHLVIEWVGKDDAMVKRLLRNKEDIYDDYTLEGFEQALAHHFEIVRHESIHDGTRRLYFARPRG